MALGDLFRSLEHLAQRAAGVEPLEPGVQFLEVRGVSPAAATALSGSRSRSCTATALAAEEGKSGEESLGIVATAFALRRLCRGG